MMTSGHMQVWKVTKVYSLGEIETQCKKAARGVGLSWGLAEEAGIVARHLSECSLPGAEAVLTTLRNIDNAGYGYQSGGIFSISTLQSPTNGLFLGIFFLDRLSYLVGDQITINKTIVGPLAVVGFLLRLRNEKYRFSVEWHNCFIQLDENKFLVSGENVNPEFTTTIKVKILRSKVKPFNLDLPRIRFPIADWDVLTEMANRTNVRASNTSRLLGAGAGNNENE